MDNNTIIKALKSKPMSFSLKEIQDIMDEELSKDPAEMDTDLIDLCMEVLEKGYAETESPKKIKKPKKFSKVFLVAAIILILSLIAIPVSANYIANHYSKQQSDLIQKLQEQGFENVTLPTDLLYYEYSDMDVWSDSYAVFAEVKINDVNSDIEGLIMISQWDDISQNMSIYEADPDIRIETLMINDIYITVMEDEPGINVNIDYIDNNTEYIIILNNCSFDTAVKTANSLK